MEKFPAINVPKKAIHNAWLIHSMLHPLFMLLICIYPSLFIWAAINLSHQHECPMPTISAIVILCSELFQLFFGTDSQVLYRWYSPHSLQHLFEKIAQHHSSLGNLLKIALTQQDPQKSQGSTFALVSCLPAAACYGWKTCMVGAWWHPGVGVGNRCTAVGEASCWVRLGVCFEFWGEVLHGDMNQSNCKSALLSASGRALAQWLKSRSSLSHTDKEQLISRYHSLLALSII